jgi:hypothetical protein
MVDGGLQSQRWGGCCAPLLVPDLGHLDDEVRWTQCRDSATVPPLQLVKAEDAAGPDRSVS